ncbi:MAG: hypothetical protein ACPGYK_10075, partial [Flavobacteriales bacterium]
MFSRCYHVALIICLLAFHLDVRAQYIGLSSEVTGESEFGTTYRVYADFGSPNDYVSAVFATENLYDDPPLVISTTTSFFQSEYATGNFASGINPTFYDMFPELEFDSWLTIGGGPGENSGVQDVGLDIELASFASGGDINTAGSYAGGSWFSTINPPLYAGYDGKVLLAQLTTEGVITLSFNLQWKNALGESADAFGQTLVIGEPALSGCTNEQACNFNSLAEEDDESCQLPQICDQCSGETDGTGVIIDGDADDDGVCDENEILGCTDSLACNYNESATDPDDCIYAVAFCSTCSGDADGTGEVFLNDDDGDGICNENELVGCQAPEACNYDMLATDEGECVYPEGCETCSGETDGSGMVLLNDEDGDLICDDDEISGCQDELACNYNQFATDSSDMCIYASGCDFCSGSLNGTGFVISGDADGDGVCNDDELSGCTYSDACNFSAAATSDDGSCDYTCYGCTDSAADNFDSEATTDDGSC